MFNFTRILHNINVGSLILALGLLMFMTWAGGWLLSPPTPTASINTLHTDLLYFIIIIIIHIIIIMYKYSGVIGIQQFTQHQ